MKFSIRLTNKILGKNCYNIGFIKNANLEEVVNTPYSDIIWLNLNGYTNGWFADPFIFKVNEDTIEVLVEEFEYLSNKGRICKIIVSLKDFKLLKVIPLLILDTHLSYPAIYEINGEKYVCPENCSSGSVKMYQLKDDNLINPCVLINEPLIDVQIKEINGSFYAFGVKHIKGLGLTETKELRIYKSSEFLGEYKYIQTIENKLCEERGAGHFIQLDDNLIRPAQCCEGGFYGKEIIFYLVSETNGMFEEKEIFRMSGDFWKRWGLGMHQFHSDDGFTVVDGFDKSKLLGRIVKRLEYFNRY